jgi:hypothetical protein
MYIRTLLWAVMVLAIEVLLVWGYIALVDGRHVLTDFVKTDLRLSTLQSEASACQHFSISALSARGTSPRRAVEPQRDVLLSLA